MYQSCVERTTPDLKLESFEGPIHNEWVHQELLSIQALIHSGLHPPQLVLLNSLQSKPVVHRPELFPRFHHRVLEEVHWSTSSSDLDTSAITILHLTHHYRQEFVRSLPLVDVRWDVSGQTAVVTRHWLSGILHPYVALVQSGCTPLVVRVHHLIQPVTRLIDIRCLECLMLHDILMRVVEQCACP